MSADTLNHDAAPGDFARIDHHDIPGYYNEDAGVVITIHDRRKDHAPVINDEHVRYPFRVIGAKNQVGFYNGVFTSRDAAVRRAEELVASYVDDD